ncbi:MAG: Gfo/Idh/MocA family oxidoreductase [Opitutales bacterium]|nr:Gfo/Idh/MocA family oxidoreductase [Opitutales bacterium]
MLNIISRRDFLQTTALAGAGLIGSAAFGKSLFTNEEALDKNWKSPHANLVNPDKKVRLAVIGCGGQGAVDAGQMAGGVEFTAFADVDFDRASGRFNANPNVPRYRDYRKMLEEQKDNIDAVLIATPDHTHFPAAVLAMNLGKHVYVEKPATHTIGEARYLKKLAAKTGLVTQMGNHGHAYSGCRDLKEWIEAGVIGDVTEVHIWTNRPVWPQGLPVPDPDKKFNIPATLDWNLWLGVSKFYNYNPDYVPFDWRGMWDWGTGAIGDMACHMFDPIFTAIDLRGDVKVSSESEGATEFSCPKWAKVKYEIGKSATRPKPIVFNWYEGKCRPHLKDLPDGLFKEEKDIPHTGMLYVGTKGAIIDTDDYGMRARLLPAERWEEFRKNRPPKKYARVPDGNARMEFIRACKGGFTPGSNFVEHSMDLTEWGLLGVLSLRLGNKTIDWDYKKGLCRNLPEANKFIHKEYRVF